MSSSDVDGALKVAALGRPCFLGQLYNGYSGQLINDTLFPHALIKDVAPTKKVTQRHKSKQLDSLKERQELLDLDASISLSIMGGAIEASGAAAYLNRSESRSASTTMAAVVGLTREEAMLSPSENALQHSVVLSPQQLARRGATHVVTYILYGGDFLGSLTQSNLAADDKEKLHAEAQIKLIQSMGAFASASGRGAIDSEKQELLHKYSLELRLVADYLGQELPVTAPALSEKIANALELLAVAVPVQMEMLPINSFTRISTELLFQELAQSSLRDLAKVYDDLTVLSKNRDALLDLVVAKHGKFFPSFETVCRRRAQEVELILLQARGRMGTFFKNYGRTGEADSSSTIESLMASIKKDYVTQKKDYDLDLKAWTGTFSSYVDQAEVNKFPFATLPKLQELMLRSTRSPVAVIVVPPSTRTTALSNMYFQLHERLANIMFSVDDVQTVECVSLFVDTSLDEALALLDDDHQTVMQAVARARTTLFPVLVSFDLIRGPLGLSTWNSLGMDGRRGWGVIFGPEMRWKYVGELKDGRPHGTGTKYGADLVSKSRFEGTFFQGLRDGYGRVFENDAVVEEGIYVDDHLEQHARIVKITVVKNGQPLDTASVAVVCAPVIDHFAPTTPDYESYARAVQALIPAQVAKIAKAFGWKDSQRHKLRSMWYRFVGTYCGYSPADMDSSFSIWAWTEGATVEQVERQIGPRRGWSDISVVTSGQQVESIDPGWRKDLAQAIQFEAWLDGTFTGSARGVRDNAPPPEQYGQLVEAIFL